jgi:IS30 family transposase
MAGSGRTGRAGWRRWVLGRAHPRHHLLAVENELNNRPRRVLGDRTPAELFAALLQGLNC